MFPALFPSLHYKDQIHLPNFINPTILYIQSANGTGQLSSPSFSFRLFIEKRILHGGANLLAYTERLLPLIRVSDLTSTGTT